VCSSDLMKIGSMGRVGFEPSVRIPFLGFMSI
jgi:hypothetical protein